MKIAVLIARILLGLIFVVFGLNGFLQFLPSGPMPAGLAGDFTRVLIQSHYVLVVAAFQVVGGALVLINRYVPLGLALLGPELVNILAFHLLMLPSTIWIGLFASILWLLLFFHYRAYFAGLFVQKAQ
jgi:putative oxidoreductase